MLSLYLHFQLVLTTVFLNNLQKEYNNTVERALTLTSSKRYREVLVKPRRETQQLKRNVAKTWRLTKKSKKNTKISNIIKCERREADISRIFGGEYPLPSQRCLSDLVSQGEEYAAGRYYLVTLV